MHTVVVVYFLCSTVFKKNKERKKKTTATTMKQLLQVCLSNHIQQTRPRHVTCYSKAYTHYTDCA